MWRDDYVLLLFVPQSVCGIWWMTRPPPNKASKQKKTRFHTSEGTWKRTIWKLRSTCMRFSDFSSLCLTASFPFTRLLCDLAPSTIHFRNRHSATKMKPCTVIFVLEKSNTAVTNVKSLVSRFLLFFFCSLMHNYFESLSG